MILESFPMSDCEGIGGRGDTFRDFQTEKVLLDSTLIHL